MPELGFNTTFACGAVAAFLTVVALRGRRALMIGGVALVLLASWSLLVYDTVRESARVTQQYEERIARGEMHLEREAALNDGTGDNAAALFIGWVPATFGAALGLLVNLAIRPRSAAA